MLALLSGVLVAQHRQRYVRQAQAEKKQQRNARLALRARAQEQAYWQKKDDEIQDCRCDALADVKADGLVRVRRRKPPALGRGLAKVPHVGQRHTWYPGWREEEGAPDNDEDDEPLAEAAAARGPVKDAQVLEEEGELDGDEREGISHAADIKDLKGA